MVVNEHGEWLTRPITFSSRSLTDINTRSDMHRVVFRCPVLLNRPRGTRWETHQEAHP